MKLLTLTLFLRNDIGFSLWFCCTDVIIKSAFSIMPIDNKLWFKYSTNKTFLILHVFDELTFIPYK